MGGKLARSKLQVLKTSPSAFDTLRDTLLDWNQVKMDPKPWLAFEKKIRDSIQGISQVQLSA